MLETQVTQVAEKNSFTPTNQLSSQPISNLDLHQTKAIHLRSGTSYESPEIPKESEGNEIEEVEKKVEVEEVEKGENVEKEDT